MHMQAGREWLIRNLGFDPVAEAPPKNTYAHALAADRGESEDFQAEIIDFDSASPQGLNFLAFSKATGLSRYKDIPWPDALKPKSSPSAGAGAGEPLPNADVLVVTWTMDEGHALSRVLSP